MSIFNATIAKNNKNDIHGTVIMTGKQIKGCAMVILSKRKNFIDSNIVHIANADTYSDFTELPYEITITKNLIANTIDTHIFQSYRMYVILIVLTNLK